MDISMKMLTRSLVIWWRWWLHCLIVATTMHMTMHIDALPFIFGPPWKAKAINMTENVWNIPALPRSITPILTPHRGNANKTDNNDLFSMEMDMEMDLGMVMDHDVKLLDGDTVADDMLLKRLHAIKMNGTTRPRMLWYDTTSDGLTYPAFVEKALKLFSLRQVAFEIENSVMTKVSCTACKAGAGLLLHYIRAGKTEPQIMQLILQFCVNLHIQSVRVCEGVSALFGSEVIYVLQRTTLQPDEICSFVVGETCGDIYNPYHEWEVVFPAVPKPPYVEPPIPLEGAAYFKVLHISDTHYDPHYAEGSNADCNEPLCCRQSSGRAVSPNATAGKWGDYRKCDSPKRTVDHMLAHIADIHPNIDYILWTGDLPPHDIWNQTRQINVDIINETIRQMGERFAGIPIFPALGNHESSPVNSFPPPFVHHANDSIAWLYDVLDAQWRQWLPSSVSHTVRRGAFYSVLVRPGFRLISLNMNYCNNKNWWLLLNSTDPATELQWLIYELQTAEFAGEKVHLIGHIPPGHPDCLKVWSRNFYRIVHRYESTIAAQFYGHTHFDEFEIFYNPKNLSHISSVAYIGPSVTPYYNLNPGYRIYYVDGDHQHTTRMVVDHESWIMNLREANLYDYPIWYKLYSARATYNMKALRPVDWDRLVYEMANDDDLFNVYHKNYWKNSPMRPACDNECRKRLLCDAKCGRSHDRKHFCEDVESKVDDGASKSWTSWFYRGLTNSYTLITSIKHLPRYIISLG